MLIIHPSRKSITIIVNQELPSLQSRQILSTAEDNLLTGGHLRNQDLVLFQGGSFRRDIILPSTVPSEAQSQLIIWSELRCHLHELIIENSLPVSFVSAWSKL